MRAGARFPATRDLARQYQLSRGTIVNAFELFKSEGYLEGSMGSGTYVSKVLPDELLQVARHANAEPRAPTEDNARRMADYARRVHLFRALNFGAAAPSAPTCRPWTFSYIFMGAARRSPLAAGSANLLLGCDPLGYRPLREAVADYLATSRGVSCAPEQIAIVSGVQEALDLVARLFLNPGDRVCMENPGYLGAAIAFESVGAKISAVAWMTKAWNCGSRVLRGARLVYVTPGHQFPLGITMSLPRRLQLLEWAGKSGALIFEDDYDSEYRYSGRPVPALQGLDRNGLGAVRGKLQQSSVSLASLGISGDSRRTWWIDFAAAISVTSRHAPMLDQAVLCDFITEGHFGRHLRRMRGVYAERLSVLLESARERLAGLLEISSIEAGLQTVGWLQRRDHWRSRRRGRREAQCGGDPAEPVQPRPMAREGLQLGFAAVDAREIRRGVEELAIALEGFKAGSGGAGKQ